MLDKAQFAAGMAKLAVVFPNRDLSANDVALRAEAYYEALSHLERAVWVYAVRQAVKSQTFFPSVAELLAYGGLGSREREMDLALERRRTPAEIEAGRRAAAEGLALVEAEVEKHGVKALPIGKPMPREAVIVVKP